MGRLQDTLFDAVSELGETPSRIIDEDCVMGTSKLNGNETQPSQEH